MLPILRKRWENFLATHEIDAPAKSWEQRRISIKRFIPLAFIHVGCILVLWVGWSFTAVIAAVALYALRALFITAFYHRYFSHRAFRTNRFWQFIFAILGNSAVQRGPLWWAAHHRVHHQYSDQDKDIHSPHEGGFFWSHFGWLLEPDTFPTNLKYVKDLAKYIELRFLDRFDYIVPAAYAGILFGIGEALCLWAPALGTNGLQLTVWGFFVSTTILFHVTSSINSIAHVFGRRRFDTPDKSRNNFILALFAMGEGWHNNHHYFPKAARQGFRWWEIDVTYYTLKVMNKLGILWDMKEVPKHIRTGKLLPAAADGADAADAGIATSEPATSAK